MFVSRPVLRKFSTSKMSSGPISNITVIGSGLMGSGIAQVAAQTGHNIRLVDQTDELLSKAMQNIKKSLTRAAKKKFGDNQADSKQFIESTLSKIQPMTKTVTAVSSADLVIEAIIEKIEEKHKLFKTIENCAQLHTIFASNTSSLSVSEIAKHSGRKDRFAGLHFFNPVPIMKLVEVVKIEETSDTTFSMLMDFSRKLGKTPVVSRDTPGFIVNRLLVPYMMEAVRMLERGDATAEDIDIAMKLGAGYPMGPLELIDYVGLDTSQFIVDGWFKKYPDNPLFQPSAMVARLVKENKLGVKSGEGFYKYGNKS